MAETPEIEIALDAGAPSVCDGQPPAGYGGAVDVLLIARSEPHAKVAILCPPDLQSALSGTIKAMADEPEIQHG